MNYMIDEDIFSDYEVLPVEVEEYSTRQDLLDDLHDLFGCDEEDFEGMTKAEIEYCLTETQLNRLMAFNNSTSAGSMMGVHQ